MSAGKGDSPRNLGPKFRENWDQIFAPVTDAKQRPGLQRRKGAEKGKAKGEKLKVKDAKPSTHSPRTVPPYPHE